MSANPFHFQYHKAFQVIATLLRSEPARRMNYYRLLKLLYIADRESLKAFGRPIIGGKIVAMQRGPLHSTAYDLVKGRDPDAPEWSKYFTTDRYEVQMVHDPGNAELSKRELDILNRIRQAHQDDDDFAVGEKTHAFAEFVKNQVEPGGVKVIPFDDLLEAIGRLGDAEVIQQSAQEKALFDRVFGV